MIKNFAICSAFVFAIFFVPAIQAQVSSFNGRTGAVVPESGDYEASQITNAAPTNAANTFTVQNIFRLGSSSGSASSVAPIVLENSGTTWLQILTPDASARGILFGDNLHLADGAIMYNAVIKNGLEFRVNGNVTKLAINSTNTAASPLLQINGDTNTGLWSPAADTIAWSTAGAERMRLNSVGDLLVTGRIEGGQVTAHYQDVAEWVPALDVDGPGTVVVLDRERDNHVRPSTIAYDSAVAGVVSVQPGLLLGESGDGKVMVATTGRVKVRVTAANGAISRGDLLVASDRPGFAMRSEPIDLGGAKIHRPGTLIGKALEPLAEGEGEILVLLSLQ